MRKLMLVPAAILAAGMLSTAVYAQTQAPAAGGHHGWHHHHHHHGGPFGHELKALNLRDSQKASVKSLFQTAHQQLKPQFEAVRTQREALNAATPGSPAYNNAASALATAASAAAGARVQQETELRTQIYALLTDPQKQQLATLQAQHQAKVAQWKAQHAQSAN